MKAKIIFRAVVGAVLSAILMTLALAKEPADRAGQKRSLLKTTGTPQYQVLNINNLTTWARYDGHSNHSPGGDDGLIFPKGTGSVIYQDCVAWGGKAYLDPFDPLDPPDTVAPFRRQAPQQLIRVGGGSYGIETSEGAVTAAMRTAIFEEYKDAWTNWPYAKGAPYIERNGTAGYQAPPAFSSTFTADSLVTQTQDEPGVAGGDPNSPADQVIWTVYNDLNVDE